MMLSPRWPRAGPIGGDGFALPAGTCNLMIPTIFFAIYVSKSRRWLPLTPAMILNLFDLRIFQFDRGRAPENRHGDFDPRLFLVDLLDEAVERGERAVTDANLFADLEGDRRLWPLDPFLDLTHDTHCLAIADRGRSPAAAEKPGDLGGVLDEVPSLFAHIHLDQHVAGKEFALRADFGAALDLDDFFGRNQDLLEHIGQPLLFGLFADRG